MRREERTNRRQGKRKKLQQISRVKHILLFSLGGLLVAAAALFIALKLTASPGEETSPAALGGQRRSATDGGGKRPTFADAQP